MIEKFSVYIETLPKLKTLTGELTILDDKFVQIKTIKGETLSYRIEQIMERKKVES